MHIVGKLGTYTYYIYSTTTSDVLSIYVYVDLKIQKV